MEKKPESVGVTAARLLIFAFLITTVWVGATKFDPFIFLARCDHYLEVVLTSWPAVTLIVATVLLKSQKEAISFFIAKRLKSLGPGGIEAAPEDAQEFQLNGQKVVVGDSQESTQSSETVEISETSILKEDLAFEKIHNVIFGSQLTILSALRKPENAAGLAVKMLEEFYTGICKDDEILNKYPFTNYLNFMTGHQLARTSGTYGEKVQITERGEKFLDYVETNGLPKNKPH